MKWFDYKKEKLSDDYYYTSDGEQSDKQCGEEPVKKTTNDDVREFNDLISLGERSMDKELFKEHFKCKRPTDMLRSLYITTSINQNNTFLNLI